MPVHIIIGIEIIEGGKKVKMGLITIDKCHDIYQRKISKLLIEKYTKLNLKSIIMIVQTLIHILKR